MANPWAVVDTVEFSGNVIVHSGSGFNILGHDDTATSGQLTHLQIRDNLVLDIDSSVWGGDGTFAQIGGEPANVTIDHNTVVHSGNIITFYSGTYINSSGVKVTAGPVTGFVFTNNLLHHNSYGIFGSGTGYGNGSTRVLRTGRDRAAERDAGNAVNLTDGLDGLAIVPVMIAAASFGMIAYLAGNAVFSDYLQINYVAGTGELAVLCGAVLGAGLGFLWFNAPPASIFMGDTGSLALGGMLGSIAVAVKHEIVLAVIGGLFVLEAVSVIVQVASFKLTGKRVFRMAPLHHHFEQKGWTEPQIVIRFWIISVMLALAGLSTLKLR